jgi:peptidoglycan-N-acetylglucosamine deacetylase
LEINFFRLPYRVDAGNIFKRGDSRLVEVPLSAYFAPYVGTTMRILPAMTAAQRHMAYLEAGLTGKPVVFDIHPNELIDESAEKRTIFKRSRNPVTIK